MTVRPGEPVPVLSLATPPEKPKFKLAWPVLIPLSLLVFVELWLQVPLAMKRADAVTFAPSYILGRFIGGVALSLLVAWVVWRLTRRADYVASSMFSAILLLFCCSEAAQARMYVQSQINAIAGAEANRYIQAKKRAEAVLARQIQFGLATGVPNLSAPGELDRRLQLVEESIASQEELVLAGDEAPKNLRGKLGNAGVRPKECEDVVRQFMSDIAWAQQRPGVGASLDIARASREMLLYLKGHPGEWSATRDIGDIRWMTRQEVEELARLKAKVVQVMQAGMVVAATNPAGK